jgi:D-alanine-D-alanine ligase
MNILKSFDFALPRSWFFRFDLGWLTSEPPKNLKLIAKPAYECASIGISNDSVGFFGEKYFRHIKELSGSLNQPVVVQEFICGYEVEVPIFDDFESFTPFAVGISLNEQHMIGDRFLSYDSIFDDEFKLFNFDKHNQHISKSLKSEANRLYQCLQLKGPVRIDFRVTPEGDYYMMDYNNSPTLARSHSFAFCIEELGFSYADMLKLIVYPALIL